MGRSCSSSIDISVLVRYVSQMGSEPLASLLGRRAAELRVEAGRRQEDVVRAARELRLPWGQSSVVDLERGRRRLSADELVLLPAVLTAALGRPVSLGELLAVDAEVDVGHVRMAAGAVAAILAGDTTEQPAVVSVLQEAAETVENIDWPLNQMTKLGAGKMRSSQRAQLLAQAGGAEQKAARQLGLSLSTVAVAAHLLWGQSLTDEREQRLGNSSGDARRLQAQRGHVTRVLLDELRTFLEEKGITRDGQR